MARPGDFFVGVLDFFAILLPGAVAAAILAPLVAPLTSDAQRWTAFLLSAFFLGHLIFLLGSYIDGVYNALRERWNPYGNESAHQCATVWSTSRSGPR